jgi:peptidoglycan-N-acetylglucosamine deacetylase
VLSRIIAATAAALIALALMCLDAGAQADGNWREIIRGDPDSNVIALTFDAGGPVGPAIKVLDTLKDHGVHATFFLSGEWIEAYPEMGQRILADGHELANHSYTHPDFTRLSNAQITYELTHTDDIVFAATGRHTWPYVRMPFGARNARVLDVAASLGYRSVYWTLDSTDWRPEVSWQRVQSRVLVFARPGDIVVEHSSTDSTAAALPGILDELQVRGYTIGTVTDVLNQTLPSVLAPTEVPELSPSL